MPALRSPAGRHRAASELGEPAPTAGQLSSEQEAEGRPDAGEEWLDEPEKHLHGRSAATATAPTATIEPGLSGATQGW